MSGRVVHADVLITILFVAQAALTAGGVAVLIRTAVRPREDAAVEDRESARG